MTEITTGIIISETTTFTITEICEVCHVEDNFLQELIDNDILPEAPYTGIHVKRIQKAIRIRNDFDVNLSGLALVLDLLDKIDDMSDEIKYLKSL